jgi:hypothetical protein
VVAPPAVLAYKNIDPNFLEQQFYEWKKGNLLDVGKDGILQFLGMRGSILPTQPDAQSSYFLGIDYLSTALILLGRTSRIQLSESSRVSLRGILDPDYLAKN